jgi:hypothetical protein
VFDCFYSSDAGTAGSVEFIVSHRTDASAALARAHAHYSSIGGAFTDLPDLGANAYAEADQLSCDSKAEAAGDTYLDLSTIPASTVSDIDAELAECVALMRAATANG